MSAVVPPSSAFEATDYMECGLSILVVGASGDLAAKKTYPSLMALFRYKLIPESVIIVGYARSARSDEDFRAHLRARLSPGGVQEDILDRFLERCYYRSGNYDDAQRVAHVYSEIKVMEDEAAPGKAFNRLFYFAIPPEIFAMTARSVSASGRTSTGWNRFIIEKPFGRDLKTFENLNKNIKDILDEDSIYRIDHYLGKERYGASPPQYIFILLVACIRPCILSNIHFYPY
jgi:glucose-6-phosphate 1-dehydrogenase